MYPWNNFLQLRVQNIYEEVFENENPDFRKAVLEKGNIVETILNLAKASNFEHTSQRQIRHGYMALVIKLGNLIEKNKDKKGVEEYFNELPN